MENWKGIIGRRLRELRQKAHDKGMSQKRAAATIGRTTAYLNRLENKMIGENPTIDMLNQLCNLYGVTMGDLFAPLVTDMSVHTAHRNAELKGKLDYILSSNVDNGIIGITFNIEAIYERVRRLKESEGTH